MGHPRAIRHNHSIHQHPGSTVCLIPRHATDMHSTIPRRTDAPESRKRVTSFISREPASVRLDTSLELLLERGPAGSAACALATVVATAGSTYRKPGARMMLMADGSFIG